MLDAVLHGGTIHLMDTDHQSVQALGIRDGRIAVVGSDHEGLSLIGPETRKIHLEGMTVVPGLIDSHIHLASSIRRWNRVDLSGCGTVSEVLHRLKTHAASRPTGTWVAASPFWHEDHLAEGRLPTRAELDETCPDHPVFVPGSLEQGVANSRVLVAAGISAGTSDVAGGLICRDESGQPTGLLRGKAQALVEQMLPLPSFADHKRTLHREMTEYSRLGLTSVREAKTKPGDARVLQSLWHDHTMPVRVAILPLVYQPGTTRLDSSAQIIQLLDESHVRTGFGDDWLKIGSLKLMLDGGLDAYMRDPYCNRQDGYRGVLGVESEVLAEILDAVAARDRSIAVHVAGDAAMDDYLAAVRPVAGKYDLSPLRWTVEHAFFSSPEQCAEIKRLGLGVTVQPPLMYDFGAAMVGNWGRDRFVETTPVRMRAWLPPRAVMVRSPTSLRCWACRC